MYRYKNNNLFSNALQQLHRCVPLLDNDGNINIKKNNIVLMPSS